MYVEMFIIFFLLRLKEENTEQKTLAGQQMQWNEDLILLFLDIKYLPAVHFAATCKTFLPLQTLQETSRGDVSLNFYVLATDPSK